MVQDHRLRVESQGKLEGHFQLDQNQEEKAVLLHLEEMRVMSPMVKLVQDSVGMQGNQKETIQRKELEEVLEPDPNLYCFQQVQQEKVEIR